MGIAKVPYFFLPRAWTLVIHSFKSEYRVFFSREAEKNVEKKNTSLFFFFPGKVDRSFIQIFDEFLFFFIKVGYVFFSPNFCVFFCVFFFLEKFTCHSFIRSQKLFFSFFIYLFDFPQKCVKNELFRRNKKIRCTFDSDCVVSF